jgi:hypothetical protein
MIGLLDQSHEQPGGAAQAQPEANRLVRSGV